MCCVSIFIFIIAASPGFSDWYYKEVSLSIVNGYTTLNKVYGVLHPIYLVYLVGYFAVIIGVIAYAIAKKRITSASHSALLALTVFGNIAIWGIEQVIDTPFEFLSISYIISELFLLILYIMLQNHEIRHVSEAADGICNENTIKNNSDINTANNNDENPKETEELRIFADNLPTLTTAEMNIYNLYLSGKQTKEITEILNITENTIKTHNKRIYKKLGISSRKQMLKYARMLNSKSH